MKILAGLGNIGPAYENSRHNLGFKVVDKLAEQHQLNWRTETQFKADLAELSLGGEKIILVKPRTMMNLSGEAVQHVMNYYKLAPSAVMVVYDEIDLPFGQLRVRGGGSSAGHNGINSIIRHIGEDFWRFRVGVANDQLHHMQSERFVLAPFLPEETRMLRRIVERTAEIIADYIAHGEPAGHDTFKLL